MFLRTGEKVTPEGDCSWLLELQESDGRCQEGEGGWWDEWPPIGWRAWQRWDDNDDDYDYDDGDDDDDGDGDDDDDDDGDGDGHDGGNGDGDDDDDNGNDDVDDDDDNDNNLSDLPTDDCVCRDL